MNIIGDNQRGGVHRDTFKVILSQEGGNNSGGEFFANANGGIKVCLRLFAGWGVCHALVNIQQIKKLAVSISLKGGTIRWPHWKLVNQGHVPGTEIGDNASITALITELSQMRGF